MVIFAGACQNPCSRILYKLEFLELLIRYSIKYSASMQAIYMRSHWAFIMTCNVVRVGIISSDWITLLLLLMSNKTELSIAAQDCASDRGTKHRQIKIESQNCCHLSQETWLVL